MPESTIYPRDIEIDTVKGGVARLLCHWGVETVLREESPIYQYEEAVIKWTLPASFQIDGTTINMPTSEDPADVLEYAEQYVSANAVEIMSFAKATKLTV